MASIRWGKGWTGSRLSQQPFDCKPHSPSRCSSGGSRVAPSIRCTGIKDTIGGLQIRSRYYPVHSYAVCSNDRSWAWCLDKPCIIDKNNPEAALCACNVVKDLGDYVIVTDKYTPDTCTSGVISSATVKAISQVTDYLATKTRKLTPFKIEVLKK